MAVIGPFLSFASGRLAAGICPAGWQVMADSVEKLVGSADR